MALTAGLVGALLVHLTRADVVPGAVVTHGNGATAGS